MVKQLKREMLDMRFVIDRFGKALRTSERHVSEAHKTQGIKLALTLVKNVPNAAEPHFVAKHVLIDVLWNTARMARKNGMEMLDSGVTSCWMIVDEMKGVEMNA